MAMKFIPLDGKKQPAYNQKVIISFKDASWAAAWLQTCTEDEHGKKYLFKGDDEYGTEYINATHYMEVETPKNNQ